VNVLIVQLDGKLPNLALMRVAHHHRQQGDTVLLRKNEHSRLWDPEWGRVYISLIFTKTRNKGERAIKSWPNAFIGGTGWDEKITLEGTCGIVSTGVDYTDHPEFQQSIGFTQRGCRLKCPFCCVPKKEGKVRPNMTIDQVWRGFPWPRELILLDNDFFGQPEWRDRIDEIREGGFKVNFNQGINARMLTDETAEALASVDYRNVRMDRRSLYTAWDNLKDERRLFQGLEALVKHGVKPREIMVYLLVGYWVNETEEDRLHRQSKIREFGAIPYPMPFKRTRELIGFQRWVVGAYDKMGVPWDLFKEARFQPYNLPKDWRDNLVPEPGHDLDTGAM
jgi:hypothetical protein